MPRRSECQELIAPKRRLLASILKSLDERRENVSESECADLDLVYRRCFAMSRIANGCSYSVTAEKAKKAGFEVEPTTVKAWTGDLARKLSAWQAKARGWGGKRRLSAKEMESFLCDNRRRIHREERRTARKYRALDLLNRYAADLSGIAPWKEWDDSDILFFLRTGWVPPRILAKKNRELEDALTGGLPGKAAWREKYEEWLRDCPCDNVGEASGGKEWQALADVMKAAGLEFNTVLETNNMPKISLRTIWALRKMVGQKTRRRKRGDGPHIAEVRSASIPQRAK